MAKVNPSAHKAKPVIALVYDFDKTLSPSNMQEYTVLPKLGIKAEDFWAEVTATARQNQAEDVLTYMRLMFEKIDKAGIAIKREDMRDLGRDVKLYEGVASWFKRIDAHIEKRTLGAVSVRHYVISAGLKEILEGVPIYDKFANVFASTYHYDQWGKAVFPDRLVNDTSKTQYLFRINKGVEDLNRSANDHMPDSERPIPFSQMVYFGDGESDVPSFTVTRKNGGHAVAVFAPGDSSVHCRMLFDKGRVDFFAPADYSSNSDLERGVKLILDKVAAGILLDMEIANLPAT
jgi:hypothetical protein